MASHLIYHPKRCVQTIGSTVVHFDRPRGNQDPYVWNDPFLHTFCHITELRSPDVGDIQIWVSGDTFPDFNSLYCDLVFTVGSVHIWPQANLLSPADPIVDTPESFQDHYKWWAQHPYKKRERKTLKANSSHSFQPQAAAGALIDIVPELGRLGYTVTHLRTALKKGFASKPLELPTQTAVDLRQYLSSIASIKLQGRALEALRTKVTKLTC
jgi:hypothetical protein